MSIPGVLGRMPAIRMVAIAGVLVAIIIAFSVPHEMFGSDSWAYYYAVENFSNGDLAVSDSLYQQQSAEVEKEGSYHWQYVQTDDGKWAIEKPPGYIFFLVPFIGLASGGAWKQAPSNISVVLEPLSGY